MNNFLEDIGFFFDEVREGQKEFIENVYSSLNENKKLMVSAPTGIGKTISVLAPSLYYAIQNDKTIIYLTSRHSQVNQIIKTISQISKKKNEKISYSFFIAKKQMCVHEKRVSLKDKSFNDFCKEEKEKGTCSFFKNFKDEEFEDDKKFFFEKMDSNFFNVEESIYESSKDRKCAFCPYEMMSQKSQKSRVIICDFNYIFSSSIQEKFFGRTSKNREDCILIVDEAHNLPSRIRNTYSLNFDENLISNFQKELRFIGGEYSKKYEKYVNVFYGILTSVYDSKVSKYERVEFEKYIVQKEEILELLDQKLKEINSNLETLFEDLDSISNIVLQIRTISFSKRIKKFIQVWEKLSSKTYVRFMEKEITKIHSLEKINLKLRIECIDPSMISNQILSKFHNSIFMSATFEPLEFYKDTLGIENTNSLILKSPFSKENQLTLLCSDITTRYYQRTEKMFDKIKDKVLSVINSKKNTIIFFPSYQILNRVLSKIKINEIETKILVETKDISKKQKEDFIEEFKHQKYGVCLFAVVSGNFSEGLDLPNKSLEIVCIVGLPLTPPDLITNLTIDYFQNKFGKGQEYGYIIPAMSKIIQAAGRCIRTNEDRGVIILMDDRYMQTIYRKNFGVNFEFKQSFDLKNEIGGFLN